MHGREGELAATLADLVPRAGQPARAVLVSGEPGIGRSRLFEAACSRLRADGVDALVTRGAPLQRTVPFASLRQLFRDDLRWDAADLTGPDHVHAEVVRPIVRLLELRTVGGPIVLAIDDLHEVDDDTVRVIGVVARLCAHLPVGWLWTARTQGADERPAMQSLLSVLRESDALHEIRLGALPERALVAMADELAEGQLQPADLKALVRRTSGNPLFATHLVWSWLESYNTGEARPAPTWALSRSGTFLERVFPLGPDARAVARLLAVMRTADLRALDHLASCAGLPPTTVQVAFDRLVAADIVRVGEDAQVQFAHELVREALYEDIGPAERTRLHGCVADTLLDQRARGGDVDVVELATHLQQSSHGPDQRAVNALREAAGELVGFAPAAAATYLREAVRRLPDHADGGDDLHVSLVRALSRAGELDEAAKVCRRALEHTRGPVREQLTRHLAKSLAATGRFREALGVVDRELSGTASAVSVAVTRAMLLHQLDDHRAALDTLNAASATATTPTERFAVALQRLNLTLERGGGERLAEALSALELLAHDLMVGERLVVHARLAHAFATMGETGLATRHLVLADELEPTPTTGPAWPWLFCARVLTAYLQGRWDAAIATYEDGASHFSRNLDLVLRNYAANAVLSIHFARRDIDAVRRHANQMSTAIVEERRAKELALAYADLIDGDADRAVARLGAAASSRERTWMSVAIETVLIEVLHRNGAHSAARDHLERLRSMLGQNSGPLSSVVLGLLEVTVLDDVGAGQRALDLSTRHQQSYHEASCRLELGRLGIDTKQNLLRAHATLSELGAVDELERLKTELRRHGVRGPSTRHDDPWQLTEPERSVAQLVADGLTNKAIAARLSYSVKTVEAYLTRIYAKTGCTNRVQLARQLGRPRHEGEIDAS